MSLKRKSTSIFPSTPLPAAKRLQLSSSSPFTPYSYPYIPSSPAPYPARPSDSPSNPFGRKRKLALLDTLPAPTVFSKHLPLRFQFVRKGARLDKEGIYRVVQVPKSYSFRHLRCLIAFLFGGQTQTELENLSIAHLFEVKKEIRMVSSKYMVGKIKSGETCVRLSATTDPYLYKEEWDVENIFDGEDNQSDTEKSEAGDEPKWRWEGEDEFSVNNVWQAASDVDWGIVYVSLTFLEIVCRAHCYT